MSSGLSEQVCQEGGHAQKPAGDYSRKMEDIKEVTQETLETGRIHTHSGFYFFNGLFVGGKKFHGQSPK